MSVRPKDIRTLDEFAAFCGVHVALLLRCRSESHKKKCCYRTVTLKKRDGGARVLQVPRPQLKTVQRCLHDCLSAGEVAPQAAAYVIGRSVLDHAACHTGAPLLVRLDLADFFGHITFPMVFHAIDRTLQRSDLFGPSPDYETPDPALDRFGRIDGRPRPDHNYNSGLSWHFAKLCTLDGKLPQGAPTSPLISNLVFCRLDRILAAWCRKHRIVYTRYSDDLAFSGDFHPERLIHFVARLLAENGFLLNPAKTAVCRKGSRQKLTGIVVNERPQTDRRYRRQIRQEVYHIGQRGIAEHLRFRGMLPAGADARMEHLCCLQAAVRLLGRTGFVLQVDPRNQEFQQYRTECIQLIGQLVRTGPEWVETSSARTTVTP